jgi:hypothetical protein
VRRRLARAGGAPVGCRSPSSAMVRCCGGSMTARSARRGRWRKPRWTAHRSACRGRARVHAAYRPAGLGRCAEPRRTDRRACVLPPAGGWPCRRFRRAWAGAAGLG